MASHLGLIGKAGGKPLIEQLYRYPIKGLSAQALPVMPVTQAAGLKGDRALAIARKPENFDPDSPQAAPKNKFLMLMRDEALARLKTHYDQASQCLSILSPDGSEERFNLSKTADTAALEQFFNAYLEGTHITPKLVQAAGHKFTDISVVSPEKMRALSIINLASVRALEKAIDASVDPMRFRANIYIDGLAPWEEFQWLDRTIALGPVTAQVVMRTKRCAATQVNPNSGARDLDIPRLIKQHFGHFDMGVYAQVMTDGDIEIGQSVQPIGETQTASV